MNPLFSSEQTKPSDAQAKLALALFVGGLILTGGIRSMVGLVLGVIAWRNTVKHPERYGGKAMARGVVLTGAAI
ncbi:MAG: hypothetical protein H0W99_05910 [Acidobacteria bacterium]|nr:hypothetical protein [Acidobacteriota bacterium]